MHARIARSITARRAAMLGGVLLAGAAWPALAQDAPNPIIVEQTPPAPAAEPGIVPSAEDEIVVSGYRASQPARAASVLR